MTDTPAQTPQVVKQAPTGATYTRAATVTGTTVALPFAFAQVVDFLGDVWHGIWPQIPDPSDSQCLAIGVLVAGIPSFWAAFSIRGTEVKQ